NAANYRRDTLARRILAPSIGDGLVDSEGGQWRAQRRLLAPLFTPQMGAGWAPAMSASANAAIEKWRGSDNRKLDIRAEMVRIAIGVLERTLYSQTGSEPVQTNSIVRSHFSSTRWGNSTLSMCSTFRTGCPGSSACACTRLWLRS